MSDIESLITEFNINPENNRLRNYYSADNVWKALRIERDENRHSDFLQWLFGINDRHAYSPLIQLLNVLIKHDTNLVIDPTIKGSILLGSLYLSNVTICREKLISELSSIRFTDRLDLYIDCQIIGHNQFSHLEIIIENKIDSPEGKPKSNTELNQLPSPPTQYETDYAKLWQTERYYFACNCSGGLRCPKTSDTAQIFVYLSPDSDAKPKSDRFITITYQDLVYYVLEPQLCRADIDDHTSFMIKDYLLNMSQSTNSNDSSLATTKEEKELLLHFYKRNEQLFFRAAQAALNNADTEEERNALSSIIVSMNKTRVANRFFSINGSGRYKMYEVLAEFVKYRCQSSADIPLVDKEISNAANQKNRCFVSDNYTKVYRYLYQNRDHFHTSKLKDNETEFYVTKELGMGDSSKNFGSLFKYFNDNYQGRFDVEQL